MFWKIAKPLLFKLDPEHAHELALKFLSLWSFEIRKTFSAENPTRLLGIHFPNQVGLAAGMDKNAKCLLAWQNLGFGFAEVGTITAKPQTGNPKPRLFRLPEHQALFNRMGFNNDGAEVVSKRITYQRKSSRLTIPIGINIGKSAIVPIENAASDYLESFELLADLADYIVINVSSPNTKNLRLLQNTEALVRVLSPIADKNSKRISPRPILVKIAPDMDEATALKIAQTALSNGVSGLIISNTSVQPLVSDIPQGGGGLSGKPLLENSNNLLASVRRELGSRAVLIGSGGVMTPEDAVAKLNHGANLVQVYTGFVYGGPNFARHCVRAIEATKKVPAPRKEPELSGSI